MKGQLKDHFSCQIIDQIFQKKTQKCQCEVLSAESSEISFGQFDDDDDDDDNDEDDNDDDDNDEDDDDDDDDDCLLSRCRVQG